MTMRMEMLAAARRAPRILGDATERVREYALTCFNPDGGVKNRAGASDLYYTVFGLETLNALDAEPPRERLYAYLDRFEDGAELDPVHLASLIRCRAALANNPEAVHQEQCGLLLARLETHRSDDGGYGAVPYARTGTIYHCFLSLAAYQDCGREPPAREGLAACVESLRAADGAYANEQALQVGTTPVTAAAMVLLKQLERPIPSSAAEWLLRCRGTEGGFTALPGAPLADLLSTATALHALATTGTSIDEVREPCLDFLESLWTGRAFCGSAADRVEDVEYTFYALLALGHLSE